MAPKAGLSIPERGLIRFVVSHAILLLFCVTAAIAQTSSTDSSTPLALSQGAPAGSFPLSGLETINAYNGNLDFHLPLLHVGGRGGAQTTLTLSLNSKHWHVLHQLRGPNQVDTFVPIPDPWFTIGPGYGPGIMTGRHSGFSPGGPTTPCPPSHQSYFAYTVTSLTLKLPDGSEHQFRDQLTDGQPAHNTCPLSPFSRGMTFVSTDGSAMTFVSDIAIVDNVFFNSQLQPSGFLMLRDGTQYRIDSGYIQWMRDRNGNSITFTYDNGMTGAVIAITSSLGETVTVTYGIQDPTLGKLDLIAYKGSGGAQRTIKVLRGTNLDGALRDSTMSVQTPAQLFPESAMNGADSINLYDPKVVTQVIIPDGRSYQFFYNPYNELARVIVPTGGTIDYETGPSSGAISGSGTITDVPNCGGGDCGEVGIYRCVRKRTVYPNGFPTIEGVTTYNQSINQALTTTTTIDHLGADGTTLLARDTHYFTGDPTINLLVMSSSAQSPDVGSPNFYPTWNEGQEYQTDFYDPARATMLKSLANTFQQRQHASWFPWGYGTEGEPAEDPQLTGSTTTLSDTGETASTTYQYDDFNNLTDSFVNDFGGGLIRHTHTDYLVSNTNGNYTHPDKAHLRNLPVAVKVFGSGTSPLAETDYEYDNYTPEMMGPVNHAHLTDRPGMVGADALLPHASDFTPIRSSTAYVTRGNVTAVTRQVFQDRKTRVSFTQFDIAGNPIVGIDPNGKTMIDFSDRFGSPGGDPTTNTPPTELPSGSFAFAFPTEVTNPAGFISYTQYDYYLGRPVNSQDWNGNNSSASYSDLLDRQTNVTRASISSTTITYLDSSHTIKVASDKVSLGDGKLVTNTIYDGLGRTTETRLFETTTAYISTTRTYDAMGRTATVSNPHRPGEDAAPTTTAYDGLSRALTVTTFDGAAVTSAFSGSTRTVTDQAGATRDSQVDAAGRLKQVTEHPGGMTTYQTTYGYDPLDDLISVTQGAQTRTFVYNSVKELTSATNPENGTTVFTYDDNGNLFTRTDALSRTTTNNYDSLNRISTRTYSDTVTPGVTYTYDDANVTNSKGRLTSVASSVSTYKYQAYDALGRVTKSTQSTGLDYTMFYAYNAAGQMTSETYPSGKVIDMTYDGADRLASVAKHLGSSYASGITYASQGAVSTMTLGNGLIEATAYNNRLQPTSIKLGVSTADPQSILGLTFEYNHMGLNDNNGNVLTQTITANSGTTQIGSQSYSYDGVNRLIGATETGAWTQTYDYDQYGNRAVRIGSYLPNSQLTPKSANPTDFSAFGGSQTRNRITLTGFGYDAVGNLTGDPTTGLNAIVYNSENRQTSYTKSGRTDYGYDGNGHRVTKSSGGSTVVFVYNAVGQLIAEYGGSPGNGGISFMTADHLGSTRAVTTSVNNQPRVVARHDYLPYGEELASGGSRTGLGYGTADDTSQRFVSRERDSESQMDYLGARYYSGPQGRYASVDPFTVPFLRQGVPDELEAETKFRGYIGNPQRWNRYSYGLNNPLFYIDPDGAQAAHYMDAIYTIGKARIDYWVPNGVGVDAAAFVASRRIAEFDYRQPIPKVLWPDSAESNGNIALGRFASFTRYHVQERLELSFHRDPSGKVTGLTLNHGVMNLEKTGDLNSSWDPIPNSTAPKPEVQSVEPNYDALKMLRPDLLFMLANALRAELRSSPNGPWASLDQQLLDAVVDVLNSQDHPLSDSLPAVIPNRRPLPPTPR